MFAFEKAEELSLWPQVTEVMKATDNLPYKALSHSHVFSFNLLTSLFDRGW